MLCRLCHGAPLQREWREGGGDRHRVETDAPDESADSVQDGIIFEPHLTISTVQTGSRCSRQ